MSSLYLPCWCPGGWNSILQVSYNCKREKPPRPTDLTCTLRKVGMGTFAAQHGLVCQVYMLRNIRRFVKSCLSVHAQPPINITITSERGVYKLPPKTPSRFPGKRNILSKSTTCSGVYLDANPETPLIVGIHAEKLVAKYLAMLLHQS